MNFTDFTIREILSLASPANPDYRQHDQQLAYRLARRLLLNVTPRHLTRAEQKDLANLIEVTDRDFDRRQVEDQLIGAAVLGQTNAQEAK
jgi:hypothetical protein